MVSRIMSIGSYCLLTFRHSFFGEQTGAGRGGLPKNKMDLIPLALPPLAEQHRIIAKVDELMTLCDRLEAARIEREASRDRMVTASLTRLNTPDLDPATFQNHAAFALNNLTPLTTRHDQIKALRQTILNLAVRGKLVPQDPNDEPASELLKRIAMERNDLVEQKIIRRDTPLAAIDEDEPPFEVPNGWEWSRIGNAVLFTQYGTSTKSSPSAPGVPVLTMGNIHAGMVVWGNEKTIPYTAEEFPALYLKQFDLLYNRTNSAELVGKTGIYLGEDDCRTFASYLIRLRASREHFSPHFLNLAMNTPEFRETQIIPLIKKQTGQANVNGTALKHMLVPVPPLAEQHRIVAKVDELMALCDQLEASPRHRQRYPLPPTRLPTARGTGAGREPLRTEAMWSFGSSYKHVLIVFYSPCLHSWRWVLCSLFFFFPAVLCSVLLLVCLDQGLECSC